MEAISDMYDRLTALGFLIGEADTPLLAYTAAKAEQTVRNECNLSQVPEALRYAVVDLAASEFLLSRKAAPAEGGEKPAAWEFGTAVRSVQEGDTTISYLTAGEGGVTQEMRLDTLISRLREDALEQLLPFRRLRW